MLNKSQVENELQELPYPHVGNNTLVIYMEQLEAAFRAAGITIPFSSNEKGMRSQSWSTDFDNVGGAVNVYGLDSYPGGTNCNANSGYTVVETYYKSSLPSRLKYLNQQLVHISGSKITLTRNPSISLNLRVVTSKDGVAPGSTIVSASLQRASRPSITRT